MVTETPCVVLGGEDDRGGDAGEEEEEEEADVVQDYRVGEGEALLVAREQRKCPECGDRRAQKRDEEQGSATRSREWLAGGQEVPNQNQSGNARHRQNGTDA